MGLVKLPIIKDYHALLVNRTILADYECNCTKYWKEDDKFLIYKANKNKIEKIYDSNNLDIINNIEVTMDVVGPYVSDKVIVAGGHTVINLKDRFNISDEVLKSVDFTFKVIAKLQEKYNKKAELLLPLNDFYMEKDAGTDEGLANKYRKDALNPYIIPPQINELLIHYSKALNRKLDFYYCSEKNMADAFKRHIKNKKKDDNELFTQDGSDWIMNIGKYKFPVITNNKPNCVAGNAATFRAIRYDINNNKVKDNFTSHIGIYPLCSMENVLNGYRAANAFYYLDLPTFFIFTGKSCF